MERPLSATSIQKGYRQLLQPSANRRVYATDTTFPINIGESISEDTKETKEEKINSGNNTSRNLMKNVIFKQTHKSQVEVLYSK